MKFLIDKSTQELERLVAQSIADALSSVLEKKEYAVLAVPGGRSVSGIFNQLLEQSIDWSHVHIFLVDDRLVGLEDEQSNSKLVKETFADQLVARGKLSANNLHPFLVDEGIESYKQELVNVGGVFDIILLSSGEDGHVGALYPEHHSIENDAAYFLVMDDSPKPPPRRMTASRSLMSKASWAYVLFLGEGKREAYRMFKDPSKNVVDCPAKLVEQIPQAFAITNLGDESE